MLKPIVVITQPELTVHPKEGDFVEGATVLSIVNRDGKIIAKVPVSREVYRAYLTLLDDVDALIGRRAPEAVQIAEQMVKCFVLLIQSQIPLPIVPDIIMVPGDPRSYSVSFKTVTGRTQ